MKGSCLFENKWKGNIEELDIKYFIYIKYANLLLRHFFIKNLTQVEERYPGYSWSSISEDRKNEMIQYQYARP